jgi:hypothetical protein
MKQLFFLILIILTMVSCDQIDRKSSNEFRATVTYDLDGIFTDTVDVIVTKQSIILNDGEFIVFVRFGHNLYKYNNSYLRYEKIDKGFILRENNFENSQKNLLFIVKKI